MKDLIIYGAGSVGRVIEQIVYDVNQDQKQWNLVGFIDDDPSKHGTEVAGYGVYGGLDFIRKGFKGMVITGFSKPSQRQRALHSLLAAGAKGLGTIIHPQTCVSRRVKIGEGSIIYPGVHIDVDVTIGRQNLFNKLCTIGHDSCFADFVTAAPGVNFGGNIQVGEGCEFGINSATVQGVAIGAWTTVGAGAIVIKDLPANCTAVGSPARAIKVQLTQ